MLEPLAGGRSNSVVKRVYVDNASGLITPEAEDELFVHYGIDPRYAGWDDYGTSPAGQTGTAARNRATGQDESRGDRFDDDASSMGRSAEQLDIDTAGVDREGRGR